VAQILQVQQDALDDLGLSDKQNKQINTIVNRFRAKRSRIREAISKARSETPQRRRELGDGDVCTEKELLRPIRELEREQAAAQAFAQHDLEQVLTQAQKATLAKLKQRQVLWQTLVKVLPKKYKSIDVYAENASLTVVVFRSQSATLKFTLKTKKIEEIPHSNKLARINRITFEDAKDSGKWVLWYNGRRELSIGDWGKYCPHYRKMASCPIEEASRHLGQTTTFTRSAAAYSFI
jgi:hypothetical protein